MITALKEKTSITELMLEANKFRSRKSLKSVEVKREIETNKTLISQAMIIFTRTKEQDMVMTVIKIIKSSTMTMIAMKTSIYTTLIKTRLANNNQ